MRKVKVQDAVGLTLCHDITAIKDRSKGPAFRRGSVIAPEDVEALLSIGKRHVYIWEDCAGMIHEEDAAARLAAAMPAEGAHYTGPSEGKVTLVADRRGLFIVDRDLLESVNSIGEITISSLPARYPVEAGAKLAAARVVPLAVSEAQIAEAERLCRGRKMFELLEYRKLRAGILVTGSEIVSGRVRDRFEPVARAKLAKFPCEVIGAELRGDEADEIASGIMSLADSGADLILISGGMSVDPDDNTPDAIRQTGAEVISHGLPSQPGNMLMMAYLGCTAVIGVPGAAISMPTTTLDVVLPSVFAGVRITRRDLIRLGDGGLCQLCESCHFPNCTYGRW